MSRQSQSYFALSAHQEAIWVESQLHPNVPIFNMGVAIELDGIPHKNLLKKAIQKVINENDALRIQFETTHNSYKAFFADSLGFQLIEPNNWNANYTKSRAIDWMQNAFKTSIEIDAKHLFEVGLVPFEDSKSFLYMKFHHIMMDGWGRSVFVHKIAEQYNALLQNETISNTSNYADFLEESQKFQKTEESALYWQSQFEDFERLELFEKKNKNASKFQSSRQKFVLPSSNLKQLTTSENLKDNFYSSLAAFYVAIRIETGKKDFVVGIPLLNRKTEAHKNTPGYFTAILPLRMNYSSQNSLQEIANDVREKLKASIPHRAHGIHEINKLNQINFTNFRQLFDVVFSFEQHGYSERFGEISIVDFNTFDTEHVPEPLVVHFQNSNRSNDVTIDADFNLNYLDASRVAQIFARFFQILTSDNALSTPVHKLPLLSSGEAKKLAEWQSGESFVIPEEHIVESILKTAHQWKEKVVTSDESKRLTYGELLEESERIAAVLQQNGIAPYDAVGVHINRSVEYFIAVFAILRCGAHFIPIDSELPSSRKAFMLNQASAKLLVCTNPDSLHLEDWKGQLINFNTESNAEFIQPKYNKDAPVYVIYTSGTTGNPKGVQVNNRGLQNILSYNHQTIFSRFPQNQKLALVSSIYFDASIINSFGALSFGHELCIVPNETRKDGKKLAHFLAKNEVTVCDGLPVLIHNMVQQSPVKPEGYCVEHYYLGGEKFLNKFAEQLFAWHGDQQPTITNAYGPTECTVNTTAHNFDVSSYQLLDDVPIGRPVFNSRAYILGDEGLPVPPGITGEICIGGVSLANGYVGIILEDNSPFQFNEYLGEQIYRTGDIGAWNEDGLLWCYGRNDHQVTVNGYRIELGEIESKINAQESIDQAIVLTREYSNGNTSLVAAIQSKQIIDLAQLKTDLSASLPEYMIPTDLVQMEALPLTKTGKVDRKVLSERINSMKVEANNHPETESEKQLASLFARIIKIKEVDVTTSFFSLGGDSLGLVYLLSEIEEEWNISLSMMDFASMNSVREIAYFLDTNIKKNQEQLVPDDYLKELHFEPNWTPKYQDAKTTLITGATGFVGIHLLKELQSKYDRIFCLVRATSEEQGLLRLQKTASNYQLSISWNSIVVIPGDLSMEDCGLSESNKTRIANQCESIYHCGASVNFLKDFGTLKAVNFDATVALLQLCTHGIQKKFHFISTTSVFSRMNDTVSEATSIKDEQHYLFKGYRASKWLAEQAVMKAQEEGISTCIYRLGRITGCTENGVANRDDFFHRLVDGAQEIGSIPKEILQQSFDLTPVDIAASKIVQFDQNSKESLVHIIHPERTSYSSFVQALQTQDYPLKTVEYVSWIEEVEALNERKPDNPFYLIMPILKQNAWLSVEHCNVVSNSTDETAWPATESLWETYLEMRLNTTKKLKE